MLFRYEVILDENGINYRKRSDDSNSEPDAAATSAAAAKENVKPNELDDLDLGLNQEKPRREFRSSVTIFMYFCTCSHSWSCIIHLCT